MNSLASEILERVFTELDGLHVVALRQVCSHWRNLIEHSVLVRYHVWLAIHGKLDRPNVSRNLSIADRLAHLLRSESSGWPNLDFLRQDELEFHSEKLKIMGFGGTCQRATMRWRGRANEALILAPLPNAQTKPDAPFVFTDSKKFDAFRPECTQDPTLDVIIYLAKTPPGAPPAFEVRSLKDPTQYHAYGLARTLDTTGLVPDDGRLWTFSKTALVADKFMLKADSHSCTTIIIWNWITDKILAHMVVPPRPRYICNGVSLIAHNAFIIPFICLLDDSETPSLAHPGCFAPVAYVELYELGLEIPNSKLPSPPRLAGTFMLPALNVDFEAPPQNPRVSDPDDEGPLEIDYDFYTFSLFHNALSLADPETLSNIPVGMDPSLSEQAHLIGGLDRTTEAVDDDRLCHLILEVHFGGGDPRQPIPHQMYDFFLYTSTFLKYLRPSSSRPSSPSSSSSNLFNLPRETSIMGRKARSCIPWDAWGAPGAAVFLSLGSFDVHIPWHARGDRVAVMDLDREWLVEKYRTGDTGGPGNIRRGEKPWVLRVLDFKPERVRRAREVRRAYWEGQGRDDNGEVRGKGKKRMRLDDEEGNGLAEDVEMKGEDEDEGAAPKQKSTANIWPPPPPPPPSSSSRSAGARAIPTSVPIIKTSTLDPFATPLQYQLSTSTSPSVSSPFHPSSLATPGLRHHVGWAFKEWPVRAELPYIETTMKETITGRSAIVEMDGEHLIVNNIRAGPKEKVEVTMFSM